MNRTAMFAVIGVIAVLLIGAFLFILNASNQVTPTAVPSPTETFTFTPTIDLEAVTATAVQVENTIRAKIALEGTATKNAEIVTQVAQTAAAVAQAPLNLTSVPPTYTPFPSVIEIVTLTPAVQVTIVTATPVSASTAGISDIQVLCPFTVTRAVVNTWQIGSTTSSSVDSYVDQFNEGRAGSGNYVKGDNLPMGVVIATSFDESGKTWRAYQVKPLIQSGNYGLFETTGSFEAPNAGACRAIVP